MKAFFGFGLVVAISLLANNLQAQDRVLEMVSPLEIIQAAPYAKLLVETDKKYSIEEMIAGGLDNKFQPITTNAIPLQPGVIWVRLLVRVPNSEQRWWLEFGNWLIDSAIMYRKLPDGSIEAINNGLYVPATHRQINSRNISFELSPMANARGKDATQTIYFRIESSLSMAQMPLSAGSVAVINQKQLAESLLIVFICCAFLVIALIGCAILVGSGDLVWIYYSLAAFFAATIFMTSTGLCFDLFGGLVSARLILCYPALEIAYLVLSLLLMLRFLAIDKTLKVVYYLPMAIIIIGTILIVIALLTPQFLLYYVTLPILLFYLLVVSVIRIIIPIMSMLRHRAFSGMYLSAFSVEILGSTIYLLFGLGILPNTLLTNRATALGGVLMFIMICYGMSVQMRRMARQIHADRLHLANLNNELEDKVALRTRELETERNKLQLLAMEDDLTGLMSRRRILELLDLEFQRYKRYASQFSLMMIDLDHFKRINDTYGHNVGDQVLRELANILRSVLRDTDLCGRLGGEEIVVILPQTGAAKAMHAAEKVRQAMASAVCKTADGEEFHVTCSIGVVESARGFEQMEEMLRESDISMYRAKAAGRNRVAMSG